LGGSTFRASFSGPRELSADELIAKLYESSGEPRVATGKRANDYRRRIVRQEISRIEAVLPNMALTDNRGLVVEAVGALECGNLLEHAAIDREDFLGLT
jgi:hypothetical protein